MVTKVEAAGRLIADAIVLERAARILRLRRKRKTFLSGVVIRTLEVTASIFRKRARSYQAQEDAARSLLRYTDGMGIIGYYLGARRAERATAPDGSGGVKKPSEYCNHTWDDKTVQGSNHEKHWCHMHRGHAGNHPCARLGCPAWTAS